GNIAFPVTSPEICTTVEVDRTRTTRSPGPPSSPMRARLAVLHGDAQPNEVDLAPERPISIGRSRDNTVVLPTEDQASRLHAPPHFENGRWLLRDFGLNGTRIDDARVNQVAELSDGSEIRIGGVRFRFNVPDPRASAGSNPGSGVKPGTVSDRSSAADTLNN